MKKTFITLFLASLIMTVGYAQERQKDTFKTKSGKDVTFTDVPTEVTHEDLPETFEDPELKAAEDKYTGDDNIYGE